VLAHGYEPVVARIVLRGSRRSGPSSTMRRMQPLGGWPADEATVLKTGRTGMSGTQALRDDARSLEPCPSCGRFTALLPSRRLLNGSET
jgi:hypothetical protein